MKKIILSFAVIMLCLSGMAQNSADLKLNMLKNKVYRFSSLTEQTIVQTINGMAQNVESTTRNSISLKMMDVTPEFMINEIRFDTLIIKTNAMGKTTLMSSAIEGNNSSAEPSEVISYYLNHLTKNPLFVKMDFTGKVLEIINSKMFSGQVLKDTSSITMPGPMGSAVKAQIAGLISNSAIINMIEPFTANLPGKTVASGENWTLKQKMIAGGMSLDISTKYRLDGISGNAASITAEADIRASENAEPINSGGAKVSYDDLKGMSKQSLVVDTQTGLLLESSAKTKVSGNLGVSAPGMSMQIPMEINGVIKAKALQ
jgi:hypothetical protein